MKLLGPTRHARFNEAAALVLLAAGISLTLCLISYHPADPSFNTAAPPDYRPRNLLGFPGAYIADWLLQIFGLSSLSIPVFTLLIAWNWVRSRAIEAQFAKTLGALLFFLGVSSGMALGPGWRLFSGTIAPGGLLGTLLASWLVANLNLTGAFIATAVTLIVSVYMVSTFSMAKLAQWLAPPIAWWQRRIAKWQVAREKRKAIRMEKARRKEEARQAKEAEREAERLRKEAERAQKEAERAFREVEAPPVEAALAVDLPPWETEPNATDEPVEPELEAEIPIHVHEEASPVAAAVAPVAALEPEPVLVEPPPAEPARPAKKAPLRRSFFELPPTELLTEPQARNPYDQIELKEIAQRIKSKFEEFNVLGNVVQINPGPVVTTFEFKPEAGIKYSRITTLSEDLCLGLQAESILIERIPGKPTVGIEVPNTKREVISLRQMLESEEFHAAPSRLTITLGKDISGRMKVASLESMPHLLIAGSTGSGKSVMLNSMIMSILYKSTPDEVRLIMVDPKRVELGIYEGIPHLLVPVITDPKKATYALRNAVFEMERRLKLLAAQGVRNIDQYNKKVRQLQNEPRKLFPEGEEAAEPLEEELEPLPLILIVIDELADLMMIERAAVEETVTRLAQMARAVGMHLVLATQRPSVDVITGLIKANFPARISFRVATRVDSRTILDVMGAEHLLGKGDMLFLPPGSSRLVRVHGAFVSEGEITRVVEFWKKQAPPDYDQTFLLAPPPEEEMDGEEEFDGEQDPMYQDAVRVVLDMGKASTSTLQRRLRLGYGRAARILDMMQREGIIGPPDGSKPREVLKRPDWLQEVENQLR